MHAKPDLRGFEMDDLSFRLGDHGRYLASANESKQNGSCSNLVRRWK